MALCHTIIHPYSLRGYRGNSASEREREEQEKARNKKQNLIDLQFLSDQHIAKVAKKNEQRIYLKEVSRAERESLKENSLEKGYDSAAKAIRTRCNS